jgi:hydrogenase/urease accessory protein HupE
VRRPSALVLALVLASAARVGAHSLDPALLDVRERADGLVDVTWKTSATRVAGAEVEPVLPPRCRTLAPPAATETDASVTVRWTVDCRPDGLVGQRIGARGLGAARTDALVRVELADGRLVRGVVGERTPFITISEHPRRWDVARDYLALGVRHILTGADHLLFVFGLLLLVGTPRRLLATITAFTAGHSVTLTAAVLGLVRVPAAPTELLIALSVFLLAAELARGPGAPSAMRRRPWLMALSFGLLHGLGFAGALRALGLPEGDIPLALVSFNAGVESGQVLFIAAVLAVRLAIDRLPAHRPSWIGWLPLYTMGSLAAFWCFERAAALLP